MSKSATFAFAALGLTWGSNFIAMKWVGRAAQPGPGPTPSGSVRFLPHPCARAVSGGLSAERDHPEPLAPGVAKKSAEIEHLRALMRAGISQAVAQPEIEKAEEERHALEHAQPKRDEKQAARVIRMLPRAAKVLRERIEAGNAGLRDPRSITQARNVPFNMFGGKVRLRRAVRKARGATVSHRLRRAEPFAK